MRERELNNAPERYTPGMVSLAMEVLKTARCEGIPVETLSKSIWAEFLLTHAQMMRQSWIKTVSVEIDQEID